MYILRSVKLESRFLKGHEILAGKTFCRNYTKSIRRNSFSHITRRTYAQDSPDAKSSLNVSKIIALIGLGGVSFYLYRRNTTGNSNSTVDVVKEHLTSKGSGPIIDTEKKVKSSMSIDHKETTSYDNSRSIFEHSMRPTEEGSEGGSHLIDYTDPGMSFTAGAHAGHAAQPIDDSAVGESSSIATPTSPDKAHPHPDGKPDEYTLPGHLDSETNGHDSKDLENVGTKLKNVVLDTFSEKNAKAASGAQKISQSAERSNQDINNIGSNAMGSAHNTGEDIIQKAGQYTSTMKKEASHMFDNARGTIEEGKSKVKKFVGTTDSSALSDISGNLDRAKQNIDDSCQKTDSSFRIVAIDDGKDTNFRKNLLKKEKDEISNSASGLTDSIEHLKNESENLKNKGKSFVESGERKVNDTMNRFKPNDGVFDGNMEGVNDAKNQTIAEGNRFGNQIRDDSRELGSNLKKGAKELANKAEDKVGSFSSNASSTKKSLKDTANAGKDSLSNSAKNRFESNDGEFHGNMEGVNDVKNRTIAEGNRFGNQIRDDSRELGSNLKKGAKELANEAEDKVESISSNAPSTKNSLKETANAGKDSLSKSAMNAEKEVNLLTGSENNESTEKQEQEEAFNPETGEINWDCPCLGGMAHGPCGEQFKAAFSCFVFSNNEPKGLECIEKFQSMQDCFNQHPEIYVSSEEIDAKNDDSNEVPEYREAYIKNNIGK